MATDPQTDIVNVDFWAGRIAALIKLAEHYDMTVEITGGELVVSRQVSEAFIAQTEVRWRAALPVGQAADEAKTRPRRGDQFDAWLKTQRDISTSWSAWRQLDYLLDRYRLHADTGTPLGEHVCESKTVGDCECLESAAGARQDGAP